MNAVDDLRRGLLTALCGALAAAGCGDEAASPADASPPSAPDALVEVDKVTCDTASETLSAELYTVLTGACTIALRLDYESKAFLGYQVFCSSYTQISARDASEQAANDTGFGLDGTVLSGGSTDGPHLFYAAPAAPGWVAAVDRNIGLSVFGGSILASGTGDITYPLSWRDSAEIAEGCASSGNYTVTGGWDLRSGTALASEDVDAVLARVANTIVPDAFYSGGYIFDATVLLYPRSTEPFDPSTAEWVTLISGGWLE